MIGNSLLTQIGIAAVAIGIVVTYIQPTIAEINSRQSEIAQTKIELETINTVNSRLNQLVERANAISSKDRTALFTYLPDEIDIVQVLKDISSRAQVAKVVTVSLAYSGDQAAAADLLEVGGVVKPVTHTFDLSIESTYDALKNLLLQFEQNNYPLEISSLNISPIDGGLLAVNFVIETYSHQ